MVVRKARRRYLLGTPVFDRIKIDRIFSYSANKRYGLAARIFGWSEKRLVRMWYDSYTLNFKNGIHTKSMRIVGPFRSRAGCGVS